MTERTKKSFSFLQDMEKLKERARRQTKCLESSFISLTPGKGKDPRNSERSMYEDAESSQRGDLKYDPEMFADLSRPSETADSSVQKGKKDK